VRASQEALKLVRVAAGAPEEQAADGQREGPREEIAAPVGEAADEPPVTEARRDLEAGARAREWAGVAEQRVVVHEPEGWAHVIDARQMLRHGVPDGEDV